MRVGILSDSHDHLANLERVVDLFLDRNVEAWIHLGDFVSPFTASVLHRLPAKRHLIFGNNDGDPILLNQVFDGEIKPGPTEISLDNRSLMLMHEPYALDAAIESHRYDLVLHGHSHGYDVQRHGRTLVVNPGESCGWITGRATCAIVNLQTLRVEILTVRGDAVDMPPLGDS